MKKFQWKKKLKNEKKFFFFIDERRNIGCHFDTSGRSVVKRRFHPTLFIHLHQNVSDVIGDCHKIIFKKL